MQRNLYGLERRQTTFFWIALAVIGFAFGLLIVGA